MNKLLLKTLFAFCLLFLSFQAKSAFAASKYWVGGGATTNWDASGNTNWSDTDGGSNNATVPAAGDDVFFKSAANAVLNITTPLLKSFDMTGYTGTLSGNGTLSWRGLTATTQNMIFAGTLSGTWVITISPTTATANLNITTNGKTLNSITSGNNTATVTLQDNLTFSNIKTLSLNMAVAGPTWDLNGKTISGNSTTSRILINSSTLGTSRTITVSAGTFANADFRDIAFANGGANLDLSAITGLSGDCGGNSMSGGGTLTLTSPVTQTSTGTASFTWSTHGWTTRVPLPQDPVVIPNAFVASQTVTADMPRLGASINWTGATGSPAFSDNSVTNVTVFGSITLAAGAPATGGNGIMIVECRTNCTLISAGKSYAGSVTLNATTGVTISLGDAFSGTTISQAFGAFDAAGFNVTLSTQYTFNSGASSKTITLGSGTWTLSGTGTVWNTAAIVISMTSTGSTMVISNTTATAKTFAGAGLTYNIITFTGQNITVSGNNSIATFNANNATTATTLAGTLLTALSTTTITTTFTTNATSTSALAIASSTTASRAELKNSTGANICLDYIDARAILFTGSSWYLGTHSTTTAGSTASSGMILADCPANVTPPDVFQIN